MNVYLEPVYGAARSYDIPIDGVHVAQVVIPFYTDRATFDHRERIQAERLRNAIIY